MATRRFRTACIAAAVVMFSIAAHAQPSSGEPQIDTGASNLIVVLRESAGENKPDEQLQPYGLIAARMPDGRRVEIAMGWYQYLGDMHIRLVFDGGQQLQSASPADLERLSLTPEDALHLAIDNLHRTYGEPVARPWSGGVMQVQGASPDLASSYFLDREFWLRQQAQHPDGVVAAVPQRGGLVFAPASDATAVDYLRFSASALYAGAGGQRISSALYIFKDGRWRVFQPPMSIQ